MKKKAEIRKKMKISLNSFDLQEKQRQTTLILDQFLTSEVYRNSEIIAAFMPMPFEFDMTRVLADQTKQIVIPKTLPNRQMIFTDFDENDLVMTDFGVKEALSNVAVTPDLIIVPGLAWSHDGYRVGFGGGYYDRYLANFKGITVSLVYNFQMVDKMPVDAYDIPIKNIFTI
ncbi:5-formyltetrahydrofolate cyclo-ligase [Lactococcus hodotermopsidis]|uniref:5-formyltetrahydrofolate cyclo-ligase n=1 Tax=Pseudolactococcus hodotermopsidis TaxID=2709157 RepID=A0A6A0BA87_9LACT|nr:5-formyltetrahydrofolate cyclo-ligase [Lactococcus hodotermopsidis]GFH42302.1 5-formyltetrahydrofolate cyclo-ligase [Lactococcus hodotermopsidis]